MPQLSDHTSAKITKMLLLGDSGSGKTGSLASLAHAGYNLRILDLDAGLDVLANLLRDSKSGYSREALSRVAFETITDPMRNIGGRLIPTGGSWQKIVSALTSWPDLGPVASWGPQEILVIDSMTMLSMRAMNFVLSMNSRLGQRAQQSDWYDAQNLVESTLQLLYDDGIKCNVIITSHISFIGEDSSSVATGYPMALGKALPPKIGRYFNSILLVRSSGTGSGVKRQILTNSTRMANGIVELKNTSPGRVRGEYPIESGLADYFRDIRSGVEAKPEVKP